MLPKLRAEIKDVCCTRLLCVAFAQCTHTPTVHDVGLIAVEKPGDLVLYFFFCVSKGAKRIVESLCHDQ